MAAPMSPVVEPGRMVAMPRIMASWVTSISRSARRGMAPTVTACCQAGCRQLAPGRRRLCPPVRRHCGGERERCRLRRQQSHEDRDECGERARAGGGPTFIEAVTYRAAPHATEHEGTEASAAIGERHDDELPCLSGDPRTKRAVSDPYESLLVQRLSERVVLRGVHLLEAEVLARPRRGKLESAVGVEEPDLREVVIERAREQHGHVLQRFEETFAEQRQTRELVECERLATMRFVAEGRRFARELKRDKLGDTRCCQSVGCGE